MIKNIYAHAWYLLNKKPDNKQLRNKELKRINKQSRDPQTWWSCSKNIKHMLGTSEQKKNQLIKIRNRELKRINEQSMQELHLPDGLARRHKWWWCDWLLFAVLQGGWRAAHGLWMRQAGHQGRRYIGMARSRDYCKEQQDDPSYAHTRTGTHKDI